MGQVYMPELRKEDRGRTGLVARLEAGRRRDPSPRGGLRDESHAPLSPGAAEARFGGRDAEEEAIKTGLATHARHLANCLHPEPALQTVERYHQQQPTGRLTYSSPRIHEWRLT